MRIHQAIFAPLAISALASCNTRNPATRHPDKTVETRAKISLDDDHNVAVHTKGDHEEYRIAPAQALIVEANGYKFKVPDGGQEPNAVHLYQGNSSNMYRLAWDPSKTIEVDVWRVQRLRGDEPFSGFKAGQKYVIGIGFDNYPPNPGDSLSFAPYWVSGINVSTEDRDR